MHLKGDCQEPIKQEEKVKNLRFLPTFSSYFLWFIASLH